MRVVNFVESGICQEISRLVEELKGIGVQIKTIWEERNYLGNLADGQIGWRAAGDVHLVRIS